MMETMDILVRLEQCMSWCDMEEESGAFAGKTITAAIDLIQKQGERLAAYESTGLEPEEIQEMIKVKNGGVYEYPTVFGEPLARIQALVHADHAGRLLVLPCKVGDTVWVLREKCKHAGDKNEPWEFCDEYWKNVRKKGMWGCAGKDADGNVIRCKKREMETYAEPIEFSLILLCNSSFKVGDSAFLTREDAESALKGRAAP